MRDQLTRDLSTSDQFISYNSLTTAERSDSSSTQAQHGDVSRHTTVKLETTQLASGGEKVWLNPKLFQ